MNSLEWDADTASCASGATGYLLYKLLSIADCNSVPIFALQMPQNCRSVSCVVVSIKKKKKKKSKISRVALTA